MSLDSYTPERDESSLEFSTWASQRTKKKVPQLYQLMEKNSLNEYLVTRAIAHKNPLDLFPLLGRGRLFLEVLHTLRPFVYGKWLLWCYFFLSCVSAFVKKVWSQILDALDKLTYCRIHLYDTVPEQKYESFYQRKGAVQEPGLLACILSLTGPHVFSVRPVCLFLLRKMKLMR